jgi:hypothetical protein
MSEIRDIFSNPVNSHFKARAARFESTRQPAKVREPIVPVNLGHDNLGDAFLAMRADILNKRPTVEPVVSTVTEPPAIDGQKLRAIPPMVEVPRSEHPEFTRKP